MTRKEWLSVVNKIDDKYINELADYQLQKKQADEKISSWEDEEALKPRFIKLDDPSEKSGKPFKKIMLAVGAVACVAAVGIFIRMKNSTLPVSPNDSVTLSNSETTQPFAGKISEKFGDVELNYEISPDFPTQLPKIRLKCKDFDEELCKSVFLRDKTIAPPKEGMADWVIYTTDDCMLAVGGDRLHFSDENIINKLKHFDIFATIWNKYCCADNTQLKSFSSAEATERVNKLLDELGIENYGEPCVVTVTPEEANAFFEETGSVKVSENDYSDPNKEYIPWGEDDGLYILKYRFNYNGIDLCAANIKTLSTSRLIKGADISVCVTKDSITFFEANTMYDILSLDEGIVDLKYDAKYASDQLVEYYSKITAVQEPTFFTECKLEYIPLDLDNGEIVFTPAWCFMAYTVNDEKSYWRNDHAEYYYADTGRHYGGY